MARWFRMHETTLDDPKVQQQLSDALFRAWVNILCLACRHDGILPPLPAIAFALRKSEKDAKKTIAALVECGLIDETETGIEPHNWKGRQYKSDVSNDRVKRHRQRQGNAPCNVTSTVPATPSENRDREQSSEAKASGGKPPPREMIFAEGLPWLVKRSALDERSCRSIIGRWMRDFGDDAVLAALEQAEQESPVDPVAWIAAKFKPRETRETWDQRRIREGREALLRA